MFGVGLAWIGTFWVYLAWLILAWLVLGNFGLFRGQTAPSPQPDTPANRPAPHGRARRPLASAAFHPRFSTRDWVDLQSIFHLPTFRLAALGRRGAPVPLGGRRGAGPGAGCAIPGGDPGNIPGVDPGNIPGGTPCRHGARLPGAENHPPGEGSGENRRGARLRVAVTRRGCLVNGERGAPRMRGRGVVMAAGTGLGPVGPGGCGSLTALLYMVLEQ